MYDRTGIFYRTVMTYNLLFTKFIVVYVILEQKVFRTYAFLFTVLQLLLVENDHLKVHKNSEIKKLKGLSEFMHI